jgi:uncharacterized protein (TIGR00369 family)
MTELPAGYLPANTNSPFGRFVGDLYEKVDAEGRAWRGLRVEEKHANLAGIGHGGLLMTLADLVLSQVIRHAGFAPTVTVRMTTDFLGPAHVGDWLEGTGQVDRATSTLVFVSGALQVGERKLLTCTGLFNRISKRHVPKGTVEG